MHSLNLVYNWLRYPILLLYYCSIKQVLLLWHSTRQVVTGVTEDAVWSCRGQGQGCCDTDLLWSMCTCHFRAHSQTHRSDTRDQDLINDADDNKLEMWQALIPWIWQPDDFKLMTNFFVRKSLWIQILLIKTLKIENKNIKTIFLLVFEYLKVRLITDRPVWNIHLLLCISQNLGVDQYTWFLDEF